MRALIEIIGDSASFLRSMEKSGAAVGAFEADLKGLTVATETSTKATVAASVKRQVRLEQEAVAYRQLAAAATAGSREQVAASNLSARANERLLASGAASRRRHDQILGGVSSTGRGLTAGVTLPAAFIGYEAVKSAVDFNQQMLLVQTNAGASAGEVKKLSREVLSFAASGQAVQGPAELAKGLFHLESLGLRGAKAMHTLKIASVAAGMGQGSLEETTSALGGVIVTGIKGAENYDKAMATLIGTAGAGNMRFGDLAGAVGNVTASAAAAGVSLPEMGAALATLTDRGMNADEAATRLRMVFSMLQKPTDKARAAFKDMGVDGDSLAKIMRQPGGLLKVLEILHAGIDKVGKTRGNKDILAAFGGGRSGLGAQVLIGSLDSPVSSYAAKVGQVQAAARKAAANEAAYKRSDSFKLKTDLVQAEAALVKLGASLAPVAVRIITTVDHIAQVFGHLPSAVKKGLGGMIVAFAIGGPLLMGGARVVKMIRQIRSALMFMGVVKGATAVEGGLAGIGSSAAGSAGKVGLLRSQLLNIGKAAGIAGAGIASFVATSALLKATGADKQLARGGGAVYDYLNSRYGLGPSYQGPRPGHSAAQKAIADARKMLAAGRSHDQVVAALRKKNPGFSAHDADMFADYGSHGGGPHSRPDDRGGPRAGDVLPPRPPKPAKLPRPPKPAALLKSFTLPYQLQLQAAQAALTATRKDDIAAARATVAYAKKMIDSGKLSHAAMLEALGVEGQALDQLAQARAAAHKKAAKAAKKKATKLDHFGVPLAMQVAQARADALAAGQPNLQGPTALQRRLAQQVKAAAMKAIRSHHLTMQGLIDAWNAVAQANATLAQTTKAKSKGAGSSYHAVSTAALTAGLGLSRNADILLRERLAQRAAHRGQAPSGAAVDGQMITEIHIHGSLDQLITKIDKRRRQRHPGQRTGGRG